MPPNLVPPTVLVALVLLAPVLLPLLTAAIYLVAGWGPRTAWLSTGSAVVVLAAVITLAAQVSTSGPRTTAGGLLRADALSAFMLLVVAVVAVVACAATPAHLRGEISAGRARTRTATQHSVLVQVFLSAMALAVLASSLGLLWVAVEATTIVTAFLVGQRRTRAAVEAAWKYVVICSTGIAMALLGTFLLNYAAGRAGTGLDWAGLTANAAGLDPGVTRIAVVLLILGFGTKAGLAPLHSWLPDAHSQAPAPVSALMSGVLLAVAFYAILRVKVIADVTLGTGFARILLAVIALASLLVAATAPDRAARLQTDACLLQHRAHGAAGTGRRHRRAPRHQRGAPAHAGSRPGQEHPVPQRRAHPAGHGHQPDRRRFGRWPPAHR